jgi:AcrR family transcriptional regulator
MLSERGYEATNIRTLAAKAHVNQVAINYHFKNKDANIARCHSRAHAASARCFDWEIDH